MVGMDGRRARMIQGGGSWRKTIANRGPTLAGPHRPMGTADATSHLRHGPRTPSRIQQYLQKIIELEESMNVGRATSRPTFRAAIGKASAGTLPAILRERIRSWTSPIFAFFSISPQREAKFLHVFAALLRLVGGWEEG